VAWCVPSCDITTVQWINVNTYEIINSNIVVLTHLGVQTYTCTAYYMYNNQSFSASQTVRLSVFPAENNPRNSTESSFAPIVSSDLYISGVVLTGPNTGYAYMYDVITCTGFSSPRPTSYQWIQQETGQVTRSRTITFGETGRVTISCQGFNVINGFTYTASTLSLVVDIRSDGSGTTATGNKVNASSSSGFAIWSILMTLILIEVFSKVSSLGCHL